MSINKESQKAPNLRFKGFTDDWEQRKFKDFTKISQGLQIAISKRFLNEGENRLFYITNEFLNPNSSVKYYIENAPESMIANSEDILMTRTGNTGKVVTNVHGAFHNNFFKIAYDKSKTNKLFLFFLLNSNYIQNEIRIGAGSSTIPDLKHPNFYKINVNITSLEEQTKIGNFFKSLDDTITLHQRKLDQLNQLKEALLQQMFPGKGETVPKLRFAGFEGDWEELKLSAVVDKQIKGKAQADKLNPGNVEYLDTARLNGGEPLLTDGISNVMKDDILILWDGSKAGTVYIGFEGALGSTLKAYRTNSDSQFVFQYLKRYQEHIYNNYRTPNIPHVQKDFLEVFTIKVPTMKEQTKIGNTLKHLDDTITLQQRKLDQLQDIKQVLLENMFI
ncbi:restriction endonuclease subunit S [Aerococcus urinaeequi]|uniref:restriction endonuclease subunit S n=1 Tax=Aerococcus urinaeequi TaxID=51665 RepID=UPI003AC399B1